MLDTLFFSPDGLKDRLRLICGVSCGPDGGASGEKLRVQRHTAGMMERFKFLFSVFLRLAEGEFAVDESGQARPLRAVGRPSIKTLR